MNKFRNKISDNGIGEYKIKKPSFIRRIVMESYDTIPASHNIAALTEFDVTEARKAIRIERKNGKKISLFAFIIKTIAIAIAKNRELNSSRNGRGSRIVEFKDVDVNIPIEIKTEEDGKIPLRIVIRNAAEKTIEDICIEIDNAKKQNSEHGKELMEQKQALKLARLLFILPRFIRTFILKKVINNPITIKKMEGTVFITSVGMYGSIPGFALPYMIGNRAVSFALGSIVKKPVIIEKEITEREFLSMTICFNHDLVDGAPAARFTNYLKKSIENADILKS